MPQGVGGEDASSVRCGVHVYLIREIVNGLRLELDGYQLWVPWAGQVPLRQSCYNPLSRLRHCTRGAIGAIGVVVVVVTFRRSVGGVFPFVTPSTIICLVTLHATY